MSVPLPYAIIVLRNNHSLLQKLARDNELSCEAFIRLLDKTTQNPLEEAAILAAHLAISTHHIHRDPRICSGDPILRGTRIRAKDIGGLFVKHPEDTRESYPHLTQSQLESAALYYLLTKSSPQQA